MKKETLLTLAALAASLLLSSCDKEELAPRARNGGAKSARTAANPSYYSSKFDANKYYANLAAALKGRTVGYSVQIMSNDLVMGAKGEGYAAYLGPFNAALRMPDKRMETAQLSATITAATMLKVIEGKLGITVDAPIYYWLPTDWTLGPNAKLITFRNLLTHGSGLSPELAGLAEPDRYENLRKLIAKGVSPANIKIADGKLVIQTYRELSANYALTQVLIPYLYWGPGKYKTAKLMNTNAATTSEAYVKLVTQLVLTPSGITAGGWNMTMPKVYPTSLQPYTRHYQFNNTANYWEQDFQGRHYAWYNRWYLSVNEYCRFVDKLFLGKLLSDASLKLMKTAQMGMRLYNPANPNDDWVQKGVMVNNGAGLATAWFAHTDEAVSAVLFVNTVGGLAVGPDGYLELPKIMKKAYDEAWVHSEDDSVK